MYIYIYIYIHAYIYIYIYMYEVRMKSSLAKQDICPNKDYFSTQPHLHVIPFLRLYWSSWIPLVKKSSTIDITSSYEIFSLFTFQFTFVYIYIDVNTQKYGFLRGRHHTDRLIDIDTEIKKIISWKDLYLHQLWFFFFNIWMIDRFWFPDLSIYLSIYLSDMDMCMITYVSLAQCLSPFLVGVAVIEQLILLHNAKHLFIIFLF